MEELEQLYALYQSMSLVINLVSLAISIFTIVVMWKVYSKAGEGGWKIFIPIYSNYIFFKIARSTKKFWANFLLGIAGSAAFGYAAANFFMVLLSNGTSGNDNTATLLLCGGLGLLLLAIAGIIRIVVNFSMAKAFGQPGIFGLGLWLLPLIFFAVIAFSSSIQHVSRINVSAYQDL